MTTRHALAALVGAALLAAVSACGTSSKPGASSEAITTPPSSQSSTTTAAAAPSACDDLGGKVNSDQLCTVHTQTPAYTVDMSFSADYPDQHAVSDALAKQRDEFVAAVEEPPLRDVPQALDITSTAYRSGTQEAGTESLVFDVYENLGGAHPETSYKALNYDLGKHAPITFETLVKPGSDAVSVLDPVVKAEFAKLRDGTPVDDNPIGVKMYENFALQDDVVIFFIGQGMWAGEAVGPQQFSIPRSELASILA
jgi:hypothetical protein